MTGISIWIPESVTLRVSLALIHFCWQGLLIAVGLGVLLRMIRDDVGDASSSRAHQRYGAACIAIVCMAVLPVVNFIMLPSPPLSTATPPSPAAGATPVDPDDGGDITADNNDREAVATLLDTALLDDRIDEQNRATASLSEWFGSAMAVRWRGPLTWTFWGWCSGVLVMSTWHLAGWSIAHNHGRRGQSVPEPVARMVQQLARRMGIRCTITLRQTVSLAGPAVMGFIRPVLLLPASVISGLTIRELEAVVAHELAHIKRYDYVVNVLQSIIESVLFYHPAVWWVSRQLRIEREYCTDDLALQVCAGRDLYVQSLVSVAELVKARPRHAIAATDGHLLARVRRLLPTDPRTLNVTRQRNSAVGGFLLIVCLTATLTAVAQKPRAPEPPDDAQASASSEDESSLAGLVSSLNLAATKHAESKKTRPLTVNDVLDQIQKVAPSSQLSDEDLARLKGLKAESALPNNVHLRQFVRYYTPSTMQHGRWVKLLIERQSGGPVILPIVQEVIANRPLTLLERMAVEKVQQGNGFVTLGRFISYFDQDPQFDQPAAIQEDYSSLVASFRKSVTDKDVDDLFALFHWQGIADGDPQRSFVRRELEWIVRRGIEQVVFVPKAFRGNPVHWQSFRTYAPNLRVDGYLRLELPRTAATPETIHLEVGHVDNVPRLACYVVDRDRTSEFVGRKLSGPTTSQYFIGDLGDGWIEFGTTIQAAEELVRLEQANLELWKIQPNSASPRSQLPRTDSIIASMQQTEAAIQNLSVTTEYVKTQGFGLPVEEPVRMTLVTKAVVEPGGRAWNETRGQQVNIEADGKTVRLYDDFSTGAFDGKVARRLRGNSATLSDQLSWHGVNPLLFTTHYFNHPISQLLAQKGAHFVERTVLHNRNVVVIDTTPTKVYRKYRFWIDEERKVVVRRAALVQFKPDQAYQEYTRIESFDHREVSPGIWLPMRVKYESVEVNAELDPEVLSWRYEGTNRDWQVNRQLDDGQFTISFPTNAIINDHRRLKTSNVPTENDTPLQEMLERLATKAKRKVDRIVTKDDQQAIVELHLKSVELESGDLEQISKLPTLKLLDLTAARFPATELGLLKALPNLRELRLYGTTLDFDSLKQLSTLESLERLDVSESNVDDQALTHLAHFSNLRYLSLRRCPISDVGIGQINSLPLLQALQLSETKLTDAAIPALEGFENLRSVTFDGTNVSPEARRQLSQRPKLAWLEGIDHTINEFIYRVTQSDFSGANDMLAIGLLIPTAGTFERLSVKPIEQQKGKRAQRYEVRFAWHHPNRADTVMRAELATDHGTIRIIRLGITN